MYRCMYIYIYTYVFDKYMFKYMDIYTYKYTYMQDCVRHLGCVGCCNVLQCVEAWCLKFCLYTFLTLITRCLCHLMRGCCNFYKPKVS